MAKPNAADWSALSEDETTKKAVVAGKVKPPTPSVKGIAALNKFFTKRTIFEGMNWIFYGDTGDGKTWMICSAAKVAPYVMVIDTEFRAQDTVLTEWSKLSDKIGVVEPVVMQKIKDKEGREQNVMNVKVTLQRLNEFVTTLSNEVESGEIPKGTIIAVESMTDFWQEIQYEGKREQAEIAGKSIKELANDNAVEWSEIKQMHENIVKQLNAMRSMGINVIYSCRRNDVDSNSKSREIACEKNLPFNTQNIVKLYTEMIDGEKVHFAVFEKMLGKETYDRVENPTFEKLDKFVRERVAKQIAGEEV